MTAPVVARAAAGGAGAGTAGRAAAGRGASKAKPTGIPIEDLPDGPLKDRVLAQARKDGIDVGEPEDETPAETPPDEKTPAKKTPAKKAPAKKAPAKKAPVRKRAVRRARPARRTLRRGVRAIAPEVGRRVVSGGDILAGTVLIAVVFLLLQNAQEAAGLLGSVSRGLAWLGDSTRSIPYRR
jgi:hypothetical protein